MSRPTRAFVDGKATANGLAREVKYNLQAERKDSAATEIDQLVLSAVARHAGFQAFAMPSRFVAPIFSRYEPGMKYGAHVDNAMMGNSPSVRTDLAMTLFLSPPDTYEGGELVVHLAWGGQEIKLDSGEAIVYPASSIHHVAPVTRGVRLAVVTWFQSKVRDERLRGILYDLTRAMGRVGSGDPELSPLLSKSYHNLVRHAAD